MIGTHNSMTYLPPKKWYMYPFRFIARCQSVDFKEQYKLGARMFDLRVRFTKNGTPEFRHGSMAFKGNVYYVLSELNLKGAYIRLILETKKQDSLQEILFIKFCSEVQRDFPNLTFFCGRRKFDWKQLYKFTEIDDIDVIQKVSSMTGTILDDWFPWLYAKCMNRANLKEDREDKWMLIDFINIR